VRLCWAFGRWLALCLALLLLAALLPRVGGPVGISALYHQEECLDGLA